MRGQAGTSTEQHRAAEICQREQIRYRKNEIHRRTTSEKWPERSDELQQSPGANRPRKDSDSFANLAQGGIARLNRMDRVNLQFGCRRDQFCAIRSKKSPSPSSQIVLAIFRNRAAFARLPSTHEISPLSRLRVSQRTPPCRDARLAAIAATTEHSTIVSGGSLNNGSGSGSSKPRCSTWWSVAPMLKRRWLGKVPPN